MLSQVRSYRFYTASKIVDGYLWVLYYDNFDGFEVFDLDSGKKLAFYPSPGPDKYYVNTENDCCRLMLKDEFDGRFGLLCDTMFITGSPHGPCSGPYLHVWELPTLNRQINFRESNCRLIVF